MKKSATEKAQAVSTETPMPAMVVPDATTVSGASPAANPGYSQGRWAGHDHFQCLSCQFDTFSEDEMVAHVQLGAHIVPLPAQEAAQEAIPAKHEAAVVETPEGPKLVGIYEVDLKEVRDGTSNAD